MPNFISLPKIGVNMTEAVIVKWLVKEGDTVKEEDHILDAETDKALQEICATKSGIVAKLLVKEGESVSCQQPLAVLIEPGEKFDEETIIEPDKKSSAGLSEVSKEAIQSKVFD